MSKRNSNTRLTLILVAGVIGMFGFCYALVPIFNIVCKQIGLNGKSGASRTIASPTMQIDRSRTIKVEFTTAVHGPLKFKFIPLQRHIEIHPGETKLVYFYAENQTGKELTVQAVPSITPTDAARFLKKTECFCFTQQYFFNHEKADMPVYFFIEPDVPKNIKEVTLAYTWIEAAYLFMFIFCSSIFLIILFSNKIHNRWCWRSIYLILIMILAGIVHDAVTATTIIFGA